MFAIRDTVVCGGGGGEGGGVNPAALHIWGGEVAFEERDTAVCSSAAGGGGDCSRRSLEMKRDDAPAIRSSKWPVRLRALTAWMTRAITSPTACARKTSWL